MCMYMYVCSITVNIYNSMYNVLPEMVLVAQRLTLSNFVQVRLPPSQLLYNNPTQPRVSVKQLPNELGISCVGAL